jgi:predicted ATPase
MATLEWITVRGFRSLASVERLQFRPINIIIGANGVGKSNLVSVFTFLGEHLAGRLNEYVARAGGADRLLFFGSQTTQRIEISLFARSPDAEYGIVLSRTDNDGLVADREFGRDALPPSDEYSDGANQRGAGDPNDRLERMQTSLRRVLMSWRVYHFHDTSNTSPMKRTADLNDNRYLRPDGASLAAFLYLLKSRHKAEYMLIRRTFQLVAPFFDDFILEPLALNPEAIRLEWKHRRSDAYFDMSALSDGSLRFVALATLLLQPASLRPSVILIDEPELGLHPYAVTLLASLIKQASIETQIILSTQSAPLLDHFEPEDVLVADLVDGATQIRRLSSTGLEVWLEDYSLGQLWEKNIIGGRPGGR